jgi:hypothetical protein
VHHHIGIVPGVVICRFCFAVIDASLVQRHLEGVQRDVMMVKVMISHDEAVGTMLRPARACDLRRNMTFNCSGVGFASACDCAPSTVAVRRPRRAPALPGSGAACGQGDSKRETARLESLVVPLCAFIPEARGG